MNNIAQTLNVANAALEEMTYDEWVNRFKPIQNPDDPDGPIDGYMFEAFGENLAFAEAIDPKFVWTVIQGDYEEITDDEDMDFHQCLLAGRHRVNSEGYVIATRPWNGPEGFEVKIDF